MSVKCVKAAHLRWPWRATDRRRQSPAGCGGPEDGFAAITILLGMVVVLVVLMVGCNFVVFEYGQGVVRTAVDQAARAGAVQQAPGQAMSSCQAKAADVMRNLLQGPFGSGIAIRCTVSGGRVVAVASGSFPGWLPPVPSLAVHIEGTSKIEEPPTP